MHKRNFAGFAKAVSLSFLFACIALTAATAETLSVVADPVQSHVYFSTRDNVHAIQGSFRVKDGNFILDPAAHTISGAMSVDVPTGQSGSHMRDGKMQSDVLESGKFPVATFTANGFEGELARVGDSHVRVHGTLRIHGSDHPMVLDFSVHIEGGNLTAHTSFPMPYIDWGMKDMSNFMFHMEKNVQIDVDLKGHIQAQK